MSLDADLAGCRSKEQPVDGRLHEPGAEVEVAGGVGLEPDLQASSARTREPVEAGCEQHAREAASLVLLLDAHRFEEPHPRGAIAPEQRVAGDAAVGSLDREVENR